MFYLYAFLLALPSPIVIVFNAEAVAVLVGLFDTRPWFLAALVLTVGQCVTFSLLYYGGEGLSHRWGWLRRKLEVLRADPEREERYRSSTERWLAVAALFGFPPLTVMSVLAPSFEVRFRNFLALAFIGRLIRFGLLSGIPNQFAAWFPVDSVPSWILQWL